MKQQFCLCIWLLAHLAFAMDASVVPVVCNDPTDCTAPLQSALDGNKSKVVLSSRYSPYIALPLFLRRDDVTIECEPGTVLLAKRNEYHDCCDSLLTFNNVTNAMLVGCTLRMWRMDYANASKYSHKQWRHGLNLASVVDTTVRNCTIESTGGDGIYMGSGGCSDGGEVCRPNRNLLVEHTHIVNAYRNGISVICADGLVVRDSMIEGTWGTAPMAGVDLEPDFPSELLNNITFDNVNFFNNSAYGITINSAALERVDTKYSIAFLNCTVNLTQGYGVVLRQLHAHTAGPPGAPALLFDGLVIENVPEFAIFLYGSNSTAARPTIFRNVLLDNTTHGPGNTYGQICIDVRWTENFHLEAPFVVRNQADAFLVYAQFGRAPGTEYNITGVFSNVSAPTNRGCVIQYNYIQGLDFSVEHCHVQPNVVRDPLPLLLSNDRKRGK